VCDAESIHWPQGLRRSHPQATRLALLVVAHQQAHQAVIERGIRRHCAGTGRAPADQQERRRYRDAGLVPIEVWVKPEHKAKVQQYAAKLRGKK
jgi:hypothetical protein